MRAVYLIARREFLSYVATIGFWISLMMAPLLMGVGMAMPFLAERAQPVRHFTVVAEDPSLAQAVARELAEGQARNLRAAVSTLARLRGDEGARDRALAAFEAADEPKKLSAALAELGLDAAAAARFEIPPSKFILVPAPARDIDGLRPYLLEEKQVSTPEGPVDLFAAVLLRRDAEKGVAVEFWSTRVTAKSDLRDLVVGAMRDQIRREAYAAAGVGAAEVERISKLQPGFIELNPAREAGEARVTVSDRLPLLMSVFFGFGLWVLVFSVVNMLLTSTLEEKSNKIMDSLLASARHYEILTGKLLGVAAVSFTLLIAWGGFGALGLAGLVRAGVTLPAGVMEAATDPALLIPFIGYFVAGYLMYGAMFLAVGSLCETLQEAQTLMSPMIFILMAPMFVMPFAVTDPDSAIVTTMSWIPLYTPFLMILRLPADPPLWEIIGSTALLVATTALILWAAGGVFRMGVAGRLGPDAAKVLLGRLLRGRRTQAKAEA